MGLGPGKKRVSVALDLAEYAALKSLAEKLEVSVDAAVGAIVNQYLYERERGRNEGNGN